MTFFDQQMQYFKHSHSFIVTYIILANKDTIPNKDTVPNKQKVLNFNNFIKKFAYVQKNLYLCTQIGLLCENTYLQSLFYVRARCAHGHRKRLMNMRICSTNI